MKVLSLIRPGPAYRADAFRHGLEASGHRLTDSPNADALLIWNRYGRGHQLAQEFERTGRPVLVAENGYCGREWRGSQWYAIARSRHNGAGTWPVGGPRWSTWNIPLSPWKAGGEKILILAQRGIGTPPTAQPKGWETMAAEALRRRTRRPVVIRKHPGEQGRNAPLDEALQDAWACVTWASGAGIKALIMGVPVFHGCPEWIGAPASRIWTGDLEAPFRGDRLPMLERMSWAMWGLDEITRGDPFRHLLQHAAAV